VVALDRAQGYVARMPSFVKSVTFDCHDPLKVAASWAEALGSDVDEDMLADRGDLFVMADLEGSEFCLEIWSESIPLTGQRGTGE
jgi:hypothetical protein